MTTHLQSAQESKLAKCKSFLLIVFISGLENTRWKPLLRSILWQTRQTEGSKVPMTHKQCCRAWWARWRAGRPPYYCLCTLDRDHPHDTYVHTCRRNHGTVPSTTPSKFHRLIVFFIRNLPSITVHVEILHVPRYTVLSTRVYVTVVKILLSKLPSRQEWKNGLRLMTHQNWYKIAVGPLCRKLDRRKSSRLGSKSYSESQGM